MSFGQNPTEKKALSPGRLLVVDDNENNRDILSRRLKRRGYQVELAENGREALDSIEAEVFDLVLLDIMMPGINGIEVLTTARKRWNPHVLPIIMVTANAQSEDVVEALKLGANDYVTKPIDMAVLQARVETHLGLKRATQELDAAYRRMKIDLNAAAAVQQKLLPASLPDMPWIHIDWRYVPCDEVGGDILNVIPLDEKRIGVYVLDVSGHGVQAALLSSALSHVLSLEGGVLRARRAGQPGWRVTPPAEVAQQLNERFPMDDQTMQYFTLLYGVLDEEDRSFNFICAGHPGPVCFLSGNLPEVVQPKGYPIGVHEDPECVEKKLQLRPGDRIYLYTDGAIEAMNSCQQEFDSSRLMECLQQVKTLDLHPGLDEVLQVLGQWTDHREGQDDISFLAFELK